MHITWITHKLLLMIVLMLLMQRITIATPAETETACAVRNILWFAQAVGTPVSQQQVTLAFKKWMPGAPLTLHELQDVAVALGLNVRYQRLTLEDIREYGGPAILHLRAAEPFGTLTAVGTLNALVSEQIIDLKTLATNYTGEALVLVYPHDARTAVMLDNPVRTIQVTTLPTEIIQRITITNRSEQVVNVAVARTSCNCTSAELSASLIEPHGVGFLTLKMRPDGWGDRDVTVTLHTSDSLAPYMMVALQAQMPKGVWPNPHQLTIQTVEGHTENRALTLLLPVRASITQLTTLHPFISAKLLATEPIVGGSLNRVQVSVMPNAPPGPFTDEVTFEFKGAEVKQLRIPIDGFIESDIILKPSTLFLDKVASQVAVKRVIVVQSQGGHAFNIRSITSTNPHLIAKADSPAMTAKHEITIDFAATGKPSSVIQDTVKFTLSNGLSLNLPVVGMVSSESTPTPAEK